MEYSFTRYLTAKQTIDDRSLNRHVLETLRHALPSRRLRIVEIGGGIGNMLTRLISWGLIQQADYTLEDAMSANIEFATRWIPQWAATSGLRTTSLPDRGIRLAGDSFHVDVEFSDEPLLEFARRHHEPADLLISNAFLDLVRLPQILPDILSLTKHLAWFTIVFDGLTIFEPTIDADLDRRILDLYHQTMDLRPSGGDSQAGRHLFGALEDAGAQVVAAGSSDWVVHPQRGVYPADEAYFLQFQLHFLEEALAGHPDLDRVVFDQWISQRRAQIEGGRLTYVAHQMDFLVDS